MDDFGPPASEAQRSAAQRATPHRFLLGLLSLLKVPLQRRTWIHMVFAVLPLGLLAIVGAMRFMKWNRTNGGGNVGLWVLLVAIAVVALCGPPFERVKARLLLGEEIGRPGRAGLLGRGTLFFFVNLLLGAVSFALVVGWAIVSARNLSYPFWGWAPYPDPAWGGPFPLGAVALHFAAGVAMFFVAPWLAIRLTGFQVRVTRRLVGSG